MDPHLRAGGQKNTLRCINNISADLSSPKITGTSQRAVEKMFLQPDKTKLLVEMRAVIFGRVPARQAYRWNMAAEEQRLKWHRR